MEQEIENADSSNGEEEKDESTTSGDETQEETVESLKEKNKKLFERAKKAEGFEEVDGLWVKKPKAVAEIKPTAPDKKDDLSSTDLYALMKADVPEEDVDEVKRTAKALNVSVAEALKDPVTKAILERRQSLRKTAEHTNTNTARPANKKVTDDEIVAKAMKGEIPEKGSEDAERLFWARRGGKR